MITTLLLNLLYPKRCIGCKKFGDLLCSACFASISLCSDSTCAVCNRQSVTGATHPACSGRYTIDGVFSAVDYKGIVKKMIYKFKYPPYLSTLKHDMGVLLYEAAIQHEATYKKLVPTALLVPVPLHAKKYRKRGYNHAELLANSLSERVHIPVGDILSRVRETQPQFSLNREERYKNLKEAFILKNQYKTKIKGRQVILVDDLATSCATLNACANVLKRAGASSVWAITFARE